MQCIFFPNNINCRFAEKNIEIKFYVAPYKTELINLLLKLINLLTNSIQMLLISEQDHLQHLVHTETDSKHTKHLRIQIFF